MAYSILLVGSGLVHPSGGAPYTWEDQTEAESNMRMCYPDLLMRGRVEGDVERYVKVVEVKRGESDLAVHVVEGVPQHAPEDGGGSEGDDGAGRRDWRVVGVTTGRMSSSTPNVLVVDRQAEEIRRMNVIFWQKTAEDEASRARSAYFIAERTGFKVGHLVRQAIHYQLRSSRFYAYARRGETYDAETIEELLR